MNSITFGQTATSRAAMNPQFPDGPTSEETILHHKLLVVSLIAIIFMVVAFLYIFFASPKRMEAIIMMWVMGIAGLVVMIAPLVEAIWLGRHIGWWRGFFAYFFIGMAGVLESVAALQGLMYNNWKWHFMYNFKGLSIMGGVALVSLAVHIAYSPKKSD